MSMGLLHVEPAVETKECKLTGGMVLLILIIFFATVISVNMLLLGFAMKTFSGLEEKNAYMAGMSHDRALAAVRAQDQRGWKVEAQLRRLEGGRTSVRLERQDAGLAPALDVVARFEHPADSRQDRSVILSSQGAQLWSAIVDVPAGFWDLVIEMRDGSEILFRSRERISVKD